VNLHRRFEKTWCAGLAERKSALEADLRSMTDELVAHQVFGGVRAAVPVPLPEHAARRMDDELFGINPPAFRVLELQGFLVVEMEE
jgi:hypothetical protein